MEENNLKEIAKLLRYYILTATSEAKSGHPTSSLSAVEILTELFFDNFFKSDLANPKSFFNDRFILSKGHAAPLLYALYVVLGLINEEEILNLRKFNSFLQGHPMPDKFLVDVATGSLGQGLSVGLGMALAMKLKIKKEERLPKVWVLLGDSEMAEGQVWEAIEVAGYYQVENLIGIVDVNRLGQRGETMLSWNLSLYQKRIEAFGWQVIKVDDGHSFLKLKEAYLKAVESKIPTMILAKTIKGKGVSFLQNLNGWHGKALDKEQLNLALKEIGEIKKDFVKKIAVNNIENEQENNFLNIQVNPPPYEKNHLVSTRKAYGEALTALGSLNEKVVSLDAEVSNSTYAEIFKKKFPERFFEMFIAEQNMISVALGFSKLGFIPFVSSFAALLTRAFDQIRMSQYSFADIKIVGSHAGVSIGEDGASQMGLEDLAMMRAILNSVVVYPSDAVSTWKLVFEAAKQKGIVYLRTTRKETPVIYSKDEEFPIGKSKIHFTGIEAKVLLITAGITLFEALKAQAKLKSEGIEMIVLDCYSVKPLDEENILNLSKKVEKIIVVEDHYPYGGLGEAVMNLLSKEKKPVFHLCVREIPKSGRPEELLRYGKIDEEAILNLVKKIL